MADWEVDSPRLRNNLLEVLRDVRDRSVRRDVPTVEDARRWQRDTRKDAFLESNGKSFDELSSGNFDSTTKAVRTKSNAKADH